MVVGLNSPSIRSLEQIFPLPLFLTEGGYIQSTSTTQNKFCELKYILGFRIKAIFSFHLYSRLKIVYTKKPFTEHGGPPPTITSYKNKWRLLNFRSRYPTWPYPPATDRYCQVHALAISLHPLAETPKLLSQWLSSLSSLSSRSAKTHTAVHALWHTEQGRVRIQNSKRFIAGLEYSGPHLRPHEYKYVSVVLVSLDSNLSASFHVCEFMSSWTYRKSNGTD